MLYALLYLKFYTKKTLFNFKKHGKNKLKKSIYFEDNFMPHMINSPIKWLPGVNRHRIKFGHIHH